MNEIEDDVPYLFYLNMDKEQVNKIAAELAQQRGCFLVEVSISKDNDVEIVIEKEDGNVDWDDCAAIDRLFHDSFDQDVEDYALTVSSAGLDRPFKVPAQYRKAIGTKVDVWMKGGKKAKGVLEAYSEEAITVDGSVIPAETINSVRPLIEFK